MNAVIEAAKAGTPVLGVCNGFQILLEAGLLPGAMKRNEGLKFICRPVIEACETSQFEQHIRAVCGWPLGEGVACALVCGEHSPLVQRVNIPVWPRMLASYSTLMPDSEEIMGWDVKDSGLHVVFSRDIPHVVQNWFKPNVEEFLHQKGLEVEQVDVFVAHPGGKKVLDAYEAALGISQELTLEAREILRYNGNMSSPTVLYVLEECMKKQRHHGEVGFLEHQLSWYMFHFA